jgi:hypothetical protein
MGIIANRTIFSRRASLEANSFHPSPKNSSRDTDHKLPHLIVGIIIGVICPILSVAATDTPAGNREWVKEATKRYSPVSWDLLMRYEGLPPELESARKGGWTVTMKKPAATFDNLKGGTSKSEWIDRMAMNIACIALSLQRFQVFSHTRENNLLMDWDRAEAFFYLSPSRSFYVSFPMRSLFPAGELAAEIPDNLRTPLFNAYIKESTLTKRFGVIGLMEEFHSHYFQSKFYLDMLEAYKFAEESDADGFLEWVRHSQSAMDAFFEFDFFIREYLLYMKRNRTADYEMLKSCRPFVETYGTVRSSYERLVILYLDLIQTEMQRLKASGKTEMGLENNILWIRAAGSLQSKGARVLPVKHKLTPVLTSDRYLKIMPDFPKQ